MLPLTPDQVLEVVLPLFAFAIGACIGSFLNVVIYRVPNGLSVNEPRRSFCPGCKTQIPLALNIPLVSWLMLRGRCKWCRVPISPRYFVVELLTGVLFLVIWKHAAGPLGVGATVSLWVFASLLVAATFIDFDHFIIPDSITIGGTVAGLLASLAFPALHGVTVWWQAGLQSLVGAAVGFALIWAVVMMGKLAFGKIRHQFKEPTEFEISQPGGEEAPIVIRLGEHEYEWGEVFYRKWDRLELELVSLCINDEETACESFVVHGEGFRLDGKELDLGEVKKVSGTITRAVVPREAMGFGDVKFVAMIGAFLGWEATVFTLFAASIVGAVVGLSQKWLAREEWARPLPFGPYLAFGAFLWLFTGPSLWLWYLRILRRGAGMD